MARIPFEQAHLRGALGMSTFIRPQTMKTLHTAVGGKIGKGGYALGWNVIKIDGVPTWFHDGSADPFLAVMVFQPSRRLGAVAISAGSGPKATEAAFELAGRLMGIKDFAKKLAAELGE